MLVKGSADLFELKGAVHGSTVGTRHRVSNLSFSPVEQRQGSQGARTHSQTRRRRRWQCVDTGSCRRTSGRLGECGWRLALRVWSVRSAIKSRVMAARASALSCPFLFLFTAPTPVTSARPLPAPHPRPPRTHCTGAAASNKTQCMRSAVARCTQLLRSLPREQLDSPAAQIAGRTATGSMQFVRGRYI